MTMKATIQKNTIRPLLAGLGICIFAPTQGVADLVVLRPLESAGLDSAYGPNVNFNYGGNAYVRQRFHPHDDVSTLLKFDVSSVHPTRTGVEIISAVLSMHHSYTQEGTPGDYVSRISALAIGWYEGSWNRPESAVDAWSSSTVTPQSYPYAGYWNFGSSPRRVGDFEVEKCV